VSLLKVSLDPHNEIYTSLQDVADSAALTALPHFLMHVTRRSSSKECSKAEGGEIVEEESM